MAVIITDAHYITALTAVRALGRAGVPTRVVADRSRPAGHAIAAHSRWATQARWLPAAAADPGAFLAGVRELAEPGDVILPVGLATLEFLAARPDALPGVDRLLPAVESLEVANDTGALLARAAAAGVPVPADRSPAPDEPLDRWADRLRLPVVVKLRAGEQLGLPARRRYRICTTPLQALEAYREMDTLQPRPLVQAYVSGGGFGVEAVYDRQGRPAVWFCHHRLREYPPSGGPSCLAESFLDPELRDVGLRLLDALDWRGVAMVEFKQDADGSYRLMEINPRLWGSLPLAVAAGVNVPLAWYLAARGEPVEPVAYRAGVRVRFTPQYVLSLPGYWRRTRARGRLLGDWLGGFAPGVHDAVWDRGDLRSSWRYVVRLVGRRRQQP